jgi:hypothetical protein
MLGLEAKIAADDDCTDLADDWVPMFEGSPGALDAVSEGVYNGTTECPEWPLMCCGSSDCTDYTDSTGAAPSTVCATFRACSNIRLGIVFWRDSA